MATDTSVTPAKKLTGAALAAPDGANTIEPITTPDAANAAGSDAMAAAQAAFAAGQDPDSLAGLQARVAELEAQRDSLVIDTGSAIEARDVAEKALGEAIKRAEAAEKKDADKPARVPAAKKPRSLGAMTSDNPDRNALCDAIEKADKVEVVLSDGRHEITAAKPIVVEGDAWRDHRLGLMLRDPVEVHGPASGAGFQIAGYALVLDGKQVAYCKRSDAINVAAGRTVSLADDIYF